MMRQRVSGRGALFSRGPKKQGFKLIWKRNCLPLVFSFFVSFRLLQNKTHKTQNKKNEHSRATRPVVFVALGGKLDDGILFFRRIIDEFLRVESAVLSLFLLFFRLFFFSFSSSSSSLRVRTTRTKIQQQQQQQSINVHHHHRRSRFFQIWVIETKQ